MSDQKTSASSSSASASSASATSLLTWSHLSSSRQVPCLPCDHVAHSREAELLGDVLQRAQQQDLANKDDNKQYEAQMWRELADLYVTHRIWKAAFAVLAANLANWTRLYDASNKKQHFGWPLVVRVNLAYANLDLSYAHRHKTEYVEAERHAKQGLAFFGDENKNKDTMVTQCRVLLLQALESVYEESGQKEQLAATRSLLAKELLRNSGNSTTPVTVVGDSKKTATVDVIENAENVVLMRQVLDLLKRGDEAARNAIEQVCSKDGPVFQRLPNFCRPVLADVAVQRGQWDKAAAVFEDAKFMKKEAADSFRIISQTNDPDFQACIRTMVREIVEAYLCEDRDRLINAAVNKALLQIFLSSCRG